MRTIILKLLFLLIIFIAFTVKANAQLCTGSLGDPIITQDFGYGINPGPRLPLNNTNYTYVKGNCPLDGSYTIANYVGDCFGNTWHHLSHDHTGNPNGYMMIINASSAPNIFYEQKTMPGQLCPNTTYEFAAWIMNIDTPSVCMGPPSLPKITFSIETTGGAVLKTYTTGYIHTSDTAQWIQYGTFFTTPANSSEAIVVKLINNSNGGCGNDIALDDITFRACGPIIQSGFGSPGGPSAKFLCQGTSAVYSLNASVSGENNPVYQWQLNIDGTGWKDIAGDTSAAIKAQFNNAAAGIYQYRAGIANGSNISSAACRVYSAPLTVTVNPLPVMPPFVPQIVCEGSPFMLSATGGSGYIWTGPNLPPTTQNPIVINNATMANSGTYTVVAMSDSGCSTGPIHAIVNVVPVVKASISADTAICAGQSAQLLASGGIHYKWKPATGLDNDSIPNPRASPANTTTYMVSVNNGGCTDSSKSVTLTVHQDPVANAGSNKTIFVGQSVTLNGSEEGYEVTGFYWMPSTYLDNPASLTPVASPPENTTFTLTVVSKNCGVATSNVFVRVYLPVTIPNTFTPNNDGINDTWNIKNLDTYPEGTIQIFNRYGQQVFQSTGYTKPWDGTYNGRALPQGTYYYVIDLKNKTPKLSGWVLIVR